MWGYVAAIVQQTSLERTQDCFFIPFQSAIWSCSSISFLRAFIFFSCWLASRLFQTCFPTLESSGPESAREASRSASVRLVTQLTAACRNAESIIIKSMYLVTFSGGGRVRSMLLILLQWKGILSSVKVTLFLFMFQMKKGQVRFEVM